MNVVVRRMLSVARGAAEDAREKSTESSEAHAAHVAVVGLYYQLRKLVADAETIERGAVQAVEQVYDNSYMPMNDAEKAQRRLECGPTRELLASLRKHGEIRYGYTPELAGIILQPGEKVRELKVVTDRRRVEYCEFPQPVQSFPSIYGGINGNPQQLAQMAAQQLQANQVRALASGGGSIGK